MKIRTSSARALRLSLLASCLCLAASPLFGQGNPLGGMGLRFDGAMAKLFGEHQAFTCELNVDATPTDRPETVSLPTRLHYANGKARCEMDLTRLKGTIAPNWGEQVKQLKAFGLAEMVLLFQPNTPTLLIYPGIKAYAPAEAAAQSPGPDRFTMVSKEVGRATFEGDECVQNQVTITGPDGKKFEAKVWNSGRLKKFPIKVESNDGGTPYTLTFRQVKFEKPAATLFETPATYTKYPDPNTLMYGVLTKKRGEGNSAGTGSGPGTGARPGPPPRQQPPK